MIKITIKIEEKEVKEIKDKLAKRIECEIIKDGINATRGEREVAELLEERIKIKDNMEVIDKTSKKEIGLDELLNKIFSL